MLICQKPAIGLVALVVGSAIALLQDCARAQSLTVDGSLGPASTLNGPNYIIPQNLGQTTGANLFHSFGKFNLDKGESAGFESTASIRNIFSRVTGGNKSIINGRIYTTSPNVNFYFLNPAGIIFGPNAQIDIGSASRGGFVATTANGIQFDSSRRFMASSSQTDVALLRTDPSAFFFNQIATAPIVNQAILKVKQGQSLLLVGGEIELKGGQLLAPGGYVGLAGVQSPSVVELSLKNNALLLNIPQEVLRTDIHLDKAATINVRSEGGGSIVITAQNLNMTGESKLQAGIESKMGSLNTQAGDIEINATQAINLNQGSIISNGIQQQGVGKSGNVNITTGQLSLNNGSQVSAASFGQGDAGSVNINARDTVSFNGVSRNGISSGAFSSVETAGVGNGGEINITAKSLFVTDGAQLVAAIRGRGNGGNINITATDTVLFDGVGSNRRYSGAVAAIAATAIGEGGSIKIKADSLSVSNGAVLYTYNRGRGSAGNIEIVATESINLVGTSSQGFSSGLFASTEGTNSGRGGAIEATTNTMRILDGAVLSARTLNSSQGGSITVNTRTLELLGGGQILSTAYNRGDAGNMTVNATDSLTISGSDPTFAQRLAQFGRSVVDPVSSVSGLFANTTTTATGWGGELTVNARQLVVKDDAQVNISSLGTGNAGSLKINADSISLSNQGKIVGETASGEGGNITLQAQNSLLLRGNSAIATTARNNGNGGNITIYAPFVIALPTENSDIIADADRGRGGSININATGIYGLEFQERLTLSSDINASSNIVGQDGTVQINTLSEKSNLEVSELPQALLDVSQLIANSCLQRSTSQPSSFTIVGTTGLPSRPQDMVVAPYPTSQVRSLSENIAASNSPFKTASIMTPESAASPELIVEANGWIRDRNGDVILTAHTPTVVPELIAHACSG